MNTEKLKTAGSNVALGLLLSEDLSEVAVLALEDGCDSPSLRTLAGLTAAETDEARVLFDCALAELNVAMPGKRDAVMHLAQETAKDLLSGAAAPQVGARHIWDLVLRIPHENLPDLDPFVHAASEWEDRVQDRQICEDGILAAARKLAGIRRV